MVDKAVYRAANILLDVVSVCDWSDAGSEANADAMSLALAQFNEQGLIPVSVETQGQVITVKVNAMNVVTASVSLLHLLLDEVVSASGGTVTSHDIIVRMREQLEASED